MGWVLSFEFTPASHSLLKGGSRNKLPQEEFDYFMKSSRFALIKFVRDHSESAWAYHSGPRSNVVIRSDMRSEMTSKMIRFWHDIIMPWWESTSRRIYVWQVWGMYPMYPSCGLSSVLYTHHYPKCPFYPTVLCGIGGLYSPVYSHLSYAHTTILRVCPIPPSYVG